MKVFIDTYALIAWLNPTDAAHEKVAAHLDNYTGRLVTTEWILMEVADALCRLSSRRQVIEFLQTVREDPNIELIGYDQATYRAGLDLFCSRHDKEWSLTDCISFAVMTTHELTEALTADHHFAQAGYLAVFK